MAGLGVVGCHDATVVDACDENPDWCLTCIDDAQCVLMGNDCVATVYCAEQDVPVSAIMIGCTVGTEYTWPPPESCTCQQNVCRSAP